MRKFVRRFLFPRARGAEMGERATAPRKQLPPTLREAFPSALYEILERFHDLLLRERFRQNRALSSDAHHSRAEPPTSALIAALVVARCGAIDKCFPHFV